MSNKYVIKHEHREGVTHYYFTSSRDFQEVQDVVDWWGESEVSPECKQVCDALNITFEPWNNEFLSVEAYEAPTEFTDLDAILNPTGA